MPTIFIALLFVLAPLSAMAQSNPQLECATPAPTEDGWQAAAPDAVGLDPAVLCGIGPRFKEWTAADIHSVLVIRHGKLVYEQYFAGADERLGQSIGIVNYDAATMHDLRSITKSVTALVLGIEIGKGQIAGVDQPVLPQLPDYGDLRSPERDKITLRHLLTMSQGLVWNEDLPYSNPANSEIQMDFSPDPVRYALAQPIQAPPGTVYTYSGGSATIIAALLRKATGHTLDELARADLFEPLGIADFEWIHFPSGDPVAASGLRMRPRDLAKIGQLVLDHGTWNGKQVVPVDWIAAATSPQINGPQLYFYGYQFWLGRSLVQGQEIDWAAGVGYGGQRLFIVPALDLVVLVHAGLYSSPMQSSVPLTILNRYVLAAVKAP
ncbi:CubicO group peptidase, beta-lactamase class C family [Rhizobiales bacterium GAS188]|nr:CubicO group peptidase, beta-lactamase class C family [Rhizobiales bacterium GAS188]